MRIPSPVISSFPRRCSAFRWQRQEWNWKKSRQHGDRLWHLRGNAEGNRPANERLYHGAFRIHHQNQIPAREFDSPLEKAPEQIIHPAPTLRTVALMGADYVDLKHALVVAEGDRRDGGPRG